MPSFNVASVTTRSQGPYEILKSPTGLSTRWSDQRTIPCVTTVLVVDDEPIVREVVVKYLEREGFRTLEAADGDRNANCSSATRPVLSSLT